MIEVPEVTLASPRHAGAIAQMSRDYIEDGLGWAWTPPRVLRAIHDRATNVAVACVDGGLLGFGIMRYGDDTAHLDLLGVLPTRQRRGLGAVLLAWLEKSASTAGIDRVRVEARADNPQALRFYGKQGYRKIGSCAGYYRGAVDAVRFEKKILGQAA